MALIELFNTRADLVWRYLGDRGNLPLLREVEDADNALIDYLVEHNTNPDTPRESFINCGIRYKLQSYIEGQARYVLEQEWDEAEYKEQPRDIRTNLMQRHSVMPRIREELTDRDIDKFNHRQVIDLSRYFKGISYQETQIGIHEYVHTSVDDIKVKGTVSGRTKRK